MIIDRRKSLRTEFWGVKLDENDLIDLAKTITDAVKEYEGEIQIEVVSGDGEDTFRSNDPEFFYDKNLPQTISDLTLSYSNYNAPISCKLHIPAKSKLNRGVELSVDGEDVTTASGLFRELKKQLDAKTNNPVVINKIHTSFFAYATLTILSTLAVYSAFDFFLNLSDGLYPDFKGSQLRSIIQNIGWFLVFMSLAFGGLLITDFMKKCFPIISFYGRISDNNYKTRKRAVWIISAIILPILLNVGTNMIDGAIKTVSEVIQSEAIKR